MDGKPGERTFVPHAFPEQTADLGEVAMNYVVAGEASKPALLLIPGQTESWWGFEKAISLLESRFQVFAVDLRGQGRSTRTPGRYSLNNMGNDLVRFELVQAPDAAHSMHQADPERFVGILSSWAKGLASPR